MDGVQWTEPTVLKDIGLEVLRGGSVFSTPGGFAWFYFYGNGTDVWRSTDGQHWQREKPRIAARSLNEERYRLISVASAADGTLHGVWQVPPTAEDPPGTSHRLIEVASIDGVTWEVTTMLLRVPGVMGRDMRGMWHSKHGWLAVFYHQSPGTAKGTTFYTLLRPQADARLLPPFNSPDPFHNHWIESGNQLVVLWFPPSSDSDGFTHLWTCPVDEIADQPLDALPRFDPQSVR